MRDATKAYGNVANKIASPRELEASLLLKAAARLQAVRDAWGERKIEINDALLYNRKLWTILLNSVTDSDNPLPTDIRQNVANLGLFVMNQTVAITGEPKPERLAPLININRQLAAGLLGRG